MKGEWRPIPGYNGYEASSEGEIRSLDRLITYKNGAVRLHRGQMLSPQMNVHGYLHVEIGRKSVPVHKLVALAFHGLPPSPVHEIAHFDNQRSNNQQTNLRWATKRDNQADRVRHGTDNRGEQHGAARLTEHDVMACRAERQRGTTLATLAERYGVTLQAIHYATSGRNWRHVP